MRFIIEQLLKTHLVASERHEAKCRDPFGDKEFEVFILAVNIESQSFWPYRIYGVMMQHAAVPLTLLSNSDIHNGLDWFVEFGSHIWDR